ncbi:solute carrier organic anion transporter family member 4A1-like, partial [Ixodes scapularis]|uniref:solute carrier organic anion transporter family member 4A1-like n=1 Tax=Ixodes scapularis TaxID=6945 RepID=UPI001A9CC08A
MALSDQRALLASDNEATPKSCGWGRVEPECLQSLRTPPWALAAFCSAGFLQGLAINGYIPVVLPTIERRFQMRSIQAGSIVSMYNVGSLLCSTPVAYFGNRQHKPRYMAIGTIVMATGSLIFAIPHFLVPPYQSSDIKDICPNLLKSDEFCATSPTNLPEYRYFFMLGNFLHGCGTSPFYTLGIAYLDDNVPTKTSPVYLGIYFAMALLGPAVGFLSGGYFLTLYTDIAKDPKEVKLNRFSKVWVGAWWMGFLVAAALAFLAAIPIFALPKELPGYRSIRAIKKSEVDKNLQSKIMEVKHEHFLGIIAVLLSNRPYVLLTMAGTLE